MDNLSLREAAQLTRCNPADLLRHIRSGRLAAIRSGDDGHRELRVARADLARAGLLEASGEAAPGPVPAPRALAPVPAGAAIAPRGQADDHVPGLLYRELLMKHEQLLVQYGMVRVGGARLFEYKAEAERVRSELDAARRGLREAEERHQEELAAVQAELRRRELRLQERDEELRVARSRLKTMEVAARNASVSESIERKFLEVMDKERSVDDLLGRPRRPRRSPSDH